MDNTEDVREVLRKKNKEIFDNKLNMDIDSNCESLSLTLNNVINKLMIELASKLFEIDKSNNEKIKELVETFQKRLLEEIEVLLTNRRQYLHSEIIKEDFDYLAILEREKNVILDKINKIYQEYLPNLMQLGKDYSEFNTKRLNDFLNILFMEKLLLKIKEELDISNACLNNIYEENVDKYRKLNDIKVR